LVGEQHFVTRRYFSLACAHDDIQQGDVASRVCRFVRGTAKPRAVQQKHFLYRPKSAGKSTKNQFSRTGRPAPDDIPHYPVRA
jgi:hypothetical protein